MDKVKEYIIKFALFEKEPLHIVFNAIIEEKIINKAYSAIQPILKLVREQHLECYHQSSRSRDEYEKHDNLTEAELIKYVKIHESQQFKEYPEPEEGGEYFLKTTEKGKLLLPEQPRGMKSVTELWQNKKTGEQLQKHILTRYGKPVRGHPHYQEPEGWD